MKYFFGEGEKETLLIKNQSLRPNVVMLLPVTRIGAKYEAKWLRIIEIIDKSKSCALVVIDKTPNGEASAFFDKHFSLTESDIYVARRRISEAIHDSQGFIHLDDNLWILQVHDDDEWNGIPYIPETAEKLEYFEVEFYVEGKEGKRQTGAEDSPPARVIFSLLPTVIWNRFAEFIQQEGGHVAGSVDSTLNLVTRLSCKRSQILGFSYVYDDRHWGDRKIATKHLLKLAAQDGWAKLTSVEISLVNRTIDGLAALSFFSQFIPLEKVERAKTDLLKSFKPSTKKRILIFSRIKAVSLATPLLKVISLRGRNTSILRALEHLVRIQEVDEAFRQTWKVESIVDVLSLIEKFQKSGELPLLENRFLFWKEQLVL